MKNWFIYNKELNKNGQCLNCKKFNKSITKFNYFCENCSKENAINTADWVSTHQPPYDGD